MNDFPAPPKHGNVNSNAVANMRAVQSRIVKANRDNRRDKLLAMAGNIALWTIMLCGIAAMGYMVLDQATQISYFSAPKMEE